jgi:competence protein ComEC
VHAGERWLLNLRLKRPHGGANPHGFDYEAWLLERGIRATGYVRPPRAETRARLLSPFVWTPGTMVDRVRQNIRERLARALSDAPHGGVIVALAIGDQRAIDSDDWQVFARTGVGHLMSISGLHVTMIASLGAFMTFHLWRRSQRLMLALAAPRAAALAGTGAALAYCLLAGFAVPAQRTLFMLAVAAWSVWRGWSGSGTRVLAIALGLVCLLDPWAPLSPGFWLSFAAVGALLLSASGKVGNTHWFKAALTAQVAVTLGLLPLTLAIFQQVSIAGPLANALAIPLVSFIITPLALLASVLPFDLLAQAAHQVLEWLMVYLDWLASFDWAVWQRAAPPWWTVLLAVAGTLWCMMPWWPHWRALGAIWLLPLLTHPSPAPRVGDLWLTVLDVGQGLAVVARTAGHTLVFDAGPRYSPEADGGNRVIVPFLRGEGVTRIDTMVVSHDDNDHSGGAASTLGAVETGELVSPLPASHRLLAAAPRHRRCVAGESWTWDGVEFTFLHPQAADYGRAAERKDNALGCVLAIRAHGRRILLPADIERDVETELVASGVALQSEVLVVPHHGSRTSSTDAFLAATAPKLAIVAAGYRNRFRHPSSEVMARYATHGILVRRTDLSGAVIVRVAAHGLEVESWRETRTRYWQGR